MNKIKIALILVMCCATVAAVMSNENSSKSKAYREFTKQQEVVTVEEVETLLYTTDVNYDPMPVVSEYVERVVAAESRGETLQGQMAVAQCIRTTAELTGQTPEQVIKVSNQYAQPVSASEVTDSVREACYRVFYLGENAVEDSIRYFYSTSGDFYSKWHENNLEYVCTIGSHKFFK